MKHSAQEVATGKIFTSSHSIDITHRRSESDRYIHQSRKLSSCEAQKKRQGISPCILKKIVILFKHWESFAPTHDFLFNPKTAFRH
ncbi:MAG: hypothetical protein F6K54_15645 [Okeania sp. SIO3B5]|uniref:hypothetical protein n=1 Tax=Okeania sp. SIO3B5 TaxID=2607811 RepID=UPI0013FEC895|nr:hypothetical protein [Okeania sp. SIO3B5]NEO54391.1 hypothetical protein [Okeania sp. SIO3B5]